MIPLGLEAENLAAAFLQQQGLRLVTRNYRCRMGEIDLIMEDCGTLVFVEVRMRKNDHFGGAGASITSHKQRKLIHAAQHYLQQQRSHPHLQQQRSHPPCRFDALLLDGGKMEWIKDAFSA